MKHASEAAIESETKKVAESKRLLARIELVIETAVKHGDRYCEVTNDYRLLDTEKNVLVKHGYYVSSVSVSKQKIDSAWENLPGFMKVSEPKYGYKISW